MSDSTFDINGGNNQFNSAAHTVNNNVFEALRPTRLRDEIEGNITREIIKDLRDYKTQQDGTLGLEKKLFDGGFSNSDITWALRKKEQYAKKATKYECYPSAQKSTSCFSARSKSSSTVSFSLLSGKGYPWKP